MRYSAGKIMDKDFIEKLMRHAIHRTWTETKDPYGFNPRDFSGGNYDDAYFGGARDGETTLARQVLDQLGIKYTISEEE